MSHINLPFPWILDNPPVGESRPFNYKRLTSVSCEMRTFLPCLYPKIVWESELMRVPAGLSREQGWLSRHHPPTLDSHPSSTWMGLPAQLGHTEPGQPHSCFTPSPEPPLNPQELHKLWCAQLIIRVNFMTYSVLGALFPVPRFAPWLLLLF